MSSKLPIIFGKEMIKFLEKKNFTVIRIRGSHNVMKNKRGKVVVVPTHKNESLGPGITREILKQAEISMKEYSDYFKK